MTCAVIRTGGKQYVIKEGEKLKIEKLPEEQGKEIVFNEVLLLEKDGKVQTGAPLVKGAKVSAKVLSQGKEERKNVLKFKNKTRYMVQRGHRQPYTEVEITKVG